MKTAKVITDGENQIVLLPEEFRLTADEVIIQRSDHSLILTPKDSLSEAVICGDNESAVRH